MTNCSGLGWGAHQETGLVVGELHYIGLRNAMLWNLEETSLVIQNRGTNGPKIGHVAVSNTKNLKKVWWWGTCNRHGTCRKQVLMPHARLTTRRDACKKFFSTQAANLVPHNRFTTWWWGTDSVPLSSQTKSKQKNNKPSVDRTGTLRQVYITDQANVIAATSALPNPIVHNAKLDLRSDRFDL